MVVAPQPQDLVMTPTGMQARVKKIDGRKVEVEFWTYEKGHCKETHSIRSLRKIHEPKR